MSSVRSVLCGRTFLRSKQMTKQIATASMSSNSHQSFDVSGRNGLMHKNKLLSTAEKSVTYSGKRYTTALSNMTKDQANELVFRLNDSERQILLQVLNQFESNKERKRLEGK